MDDNLYSFLRSIDSNLIIDVSDVCGNILYVNNSFCECLGFNFSDLLEGNYKKMYSGFHTEDFFKKLWVTISRGDIWRNKIFNRSKSGEVYWFDTIIFPYYDNCRKVKYYISIKEKINNSNMTPFENKIVNELRYSIENNDLILYYQKIVNYKKETIGYEALLRWDHPERGIILPDDFIYLAEDSNMMMDIGSYIIKKACIKLQTWKFNEKYKNYIISVNISPSQLFLQNFVDELISVVEYYNIDPKKLHLEITEKISYDSNEIKNKINRLRQYGFNFSLDDFGKGTASISLLRNYPFSTIKIDRSFIENILINSKELSILESIINLAKKINVSVIVEGIEDEHQFLLLEKFDEIAFQGYFFGKPEALD